MHHKKKIYLTFYIDNVKLIESDEHTFDEISHQIAKHFQITNKDQIHHYLDMKIEFDHQNQTICLNQKIYIKQLLKQFGMQNCLLMSTLMQHSLQILDQSLKKYIKFIIETEYIAVSETSCKIISICDILQELGMIDSDFIFSLLIDNNNVIVISKDEKITCNTHHIEICYHHIQD